MSKWPAVPLCDIADIRHGGTPSKAKTEYWKGAIPWVSPKDFLSDTITDATDHISDEAVLDSATSVVPSETILVVARSGILARRVPVAFCAVPVAFNQDIKAFIPRRDQIAPEYLAWFLRSQESKILARGVKRGATVHSLHSRFVEQLQVPLPPLNEQRRIVDILNRANGILRLRRQAQEKARQLIPALFVKMFGDLASNSHKCEIIRFCDLLVRPLRNGISPSRRGRRRAHVLTLSAITRGYFDATAIKVGLFEVPLRLSDQVSSEDFLICRGNGNLGLVGRGQFPNCSMQDVAFPDTIIASRPDTTRLMPEYLQAVWNTDFLRRQIETAAKTTNGTFKINQSATENFRLPLPPIGLQRTFATHVGNIHSIIAQQNRMAAASERLVGSLMHQMFDGA